MLSACGGESLTDDEQTAVLEARVAFSQTVLDSSMYAETLDGVDMLIDLYRAKPDATVEQYEDRDVTVRQAVIDAANTLREYRPELAAKLELALKDKP
jgi:hypothetical protein